MINGYIWDDLPIDHNVIRRAEYISTNKYQPTIYNRHPIFEWLAGHEIIDE